MRITSLETQRGQTLPLWTFGTMTILVMLAYAFSYGTLIQWHIRAQNAADAAAQGLLTAQTSQWNQTVITLHAAAVEEYRLRFVINDILQVSRGSGGCNSSGTASDCRVMYGQLRQAYFDSLERYTTDVALLHRIDQPTFANDVTAIQTALALYQDSTHCGTPQGGDCAFDYTLLPVSTRANSYLENVYSDCCGFTVGGGTSADPKQDFQPMELEIVACANVPWPLKLFKFEPPNYMAIGRAAATPIMVTQEFEYIGSLVNPDSPSGAVFQPSEFPETAYGSAALTASDDENYRIDYGGNPNDPENGGNPATSNGQAAFTYTPGDMGLLVADGWWGSMAIKPFSGTISTAKFSCK